MEDSGNFLSEVNRNWMALLGELNSHPRNLDGLRTIHYYYYNNETWKPKCVPQYAQQGQA